jgi:hypothetical protein
MNPAKGTQSAQTTKPKDLMIAVDFGAGSALAIYGDDGVERAPKLPRVPGGASTSDKFIRMLPILLDRDDVVVESPTIGSSGVEPSDVSGIVANAGHRLYVLSARATKNYKKDNGITWDKGARYSKDGDPLDIELHEQPNVHESDAQILHAIATESPARLKLWRPMDSSLKRLHTSVRPHDKRNYRGDIPDRYMNRWPPFGQLPDHLQQLFGNNYGTPKAEYSRALAMPLAMAMEESGSDTRDGFEKIIGLYDHGYPSFYRRKTTSDLMHKLAKDRFGLDRIEELSREQRKEAQKLTRRYIREVWHILSNSQGSSQ